MWSMQQWQVLAAALAMSAALLVIVLSGVALSVRNHAVTTLDWSIAVDEQHALTFRNEPTCLPGLSSLACESGLTRDELHIMFVAGTQRYVLVSIVAP